MQTVDGTINMERIREFAELKSKAMSLQRELEEIEERVAQLKPRIKADFEREGVPRVPVAGFGTVHLQRTGWAKVVKDDPTKEKVSPEERERANEALRAAGLGDYVTESFNTHSLSAYFRELDREGREFPEELEGAITFEKDFDVRLRRAGE